MKIKHYKIAFYIWTGILFTLTSIPKLQSPINDSLNVDKLAHFMVYMIFAYLFMKMFDEKQFIKKLKLLSVLAVIIPIFDELHQIPIPGRSFSYNDILADFLGFLAVIIYFKIKLK
ncbi:MAG: VanZ family protein [Candidatus Cloacimonetes bacterium]|jgi:VanZ family protein|nr:VanZ family protein [Candidatus Cloacimonadota bacterium]